jgi:hypothetical protein
MRLSGGGTGKRAFMIENLELTGLMKPFDTEIWFGYRVAVPGSNGSGKSHSSQTHHHPELMGRTLLEILHRGDDHRAGMGREEASRKLDRSELARSAEQRFEALSGGQQARLQILLLELSDATLFSSTSRPTISTWSRPRRWSRGSIPSMAR